MKTVYSVILFSLIAFSSQLKATGVAFAASSGQIVLDGTPITGATIDDSNLTIVGFYVNAASFATFSGDAAFGQSTSISTDQLSAIVTALNTASGSTYNQFTLTPSANVDGFGVLNTVIDPNNPFDSGSAGNHAVMIVMNKSSLDALTVGDSLGVVTTTAQTAALGNFTVDFTGASTWDTTLVGTAGSLITASVVPEPSSFALLAGCFGMAWVMVRRRA